MRSICIRKGAIVSSQYIPAADFTPHANPDDLGDYRWNDRLVNHLFCLTCGIYPYTATTSTDIASTSAASKASILFSLDISILDGRSLRLREEE